MPSAQVALATITLGSAQSTVTFSSIPATYRDLRLVIGGSLTTGGYYCNLRFNSDTGSNYSQVNMRGNGSSAASGSGNFAFIYLAYAGFNPGGIVSTTADIMDFSATDKHKTVLNRSNDTTATVDANAARWANTAAITSMVIYTDSTFAAGSTFSLYGILA